jgi:superfamily II DNA or RNA helicase
VGFLRRLYPLLCGTSLAALFTMRDFARILKVCCSVFRRSFGRETALFAALAFSLCTRAWGWPPSEQDVIGALVEVTGNPTALQGWSHYERSHAPTPARNDPRFGTRWERRGEELRVFFFDRFAPSGLSEIRIHLQIPKPEEALASSEDAGFHATLNGVQFRERESATADAPHREVYLGDVTSRESLEDRLRLAINDNEVLNPWHRRRVPELVKEWKESTSAIATKPQTEMVDFLWSQRQAGNLARGALIQMPTGMGKTETIQFFLKRLESGKVPFRLLWMVHGNDLVTQTAERLAPFLNSRKESVLAWNSVTVKTRDDRTQIGAGAMQHVFVSMDSLQADSENRALLQRWINKPGGAPLVLAVDEAHQMGDETYKALYDWLWKDFQSGIQARIGVTATPIHKTAGSIAEYFGNRSKWAFVEESEIDAVTGLPRISFLQQMNRAARKGYAPIPLVYALGKDPLEAHPTDNVYTREELASTQEMLRRFFPLKGIVYHATGASEAYGATSRMRQYQKEAVELGLPLYAVGGSDTPEQRTNELSSYKRSTHGILNLTGVGSVGLDLPGTNTVVLLHAPKDNLPLITQRFGRSARLIPGGPFTRWVDWTGSALKQMVADVASFTTKGWSETRRTKLKELLKRNEEQPSSETIKALYEVLGIDPNLVHADPTLFESILNEVSQASNLPRWDVKSADSQLSPHKLPQSAPNESLSAYLRREDVHKTLNLRLGRDVNDAVTTIIPGIVANAIAGDLVGVDPQQVLNSWGYYTSSLRKQAGEARKRELTFSAREASSQSSPHKLPQPGLNESLIAYLRREDVLRAINLRLGRDEKDTATAIANRDAARAIAGDLVGVNAQQVSNSWNGYTSSLRRQVGEARKRELTFSVREASSQLSPHKLPQPGLKESRRAYLSREDVLKALNLRLGRDEKDTATTITPGDAVRAIANDLVGVGSEQVYEGWNSYTSSLRRQAGGARKRELTFSVKEASSQPSTHKLPQSEPNEPLGVYLRREEVLITLNLRLGRDVNDAATTIIPADAARAISNDLVGVDPQQVSASWGGNTSLLRKQAGETREKQRALFLVREASSQLSPHKLPQPGLNESLLAYLRREDVLRALNLRLGRDEGNGATTMISGDAKNAIAGDLVGVDAQQIANRWRVYTSSLRRQAREARKNKLTFSVKDASVQSSRHKLLQSGPNESLGAYLRREEVLRTLNFRLGRDVNEDATAITSGEAARALADDLIGVDAQQVSKNWGTYISSLRKQAKEPGPTVQPSHGFWPQSQRLRQELPRLGHLHYTVARQLLERLKKRPSLEIYFVGRDADDFLRVAEEVTRAGAPELLPQLRRILLSNKLLGVDPANPSLYANLDRAAIRRLLESQGMSANGLAQREVLLFDVGFDGHVMRPILGALLEHSGLFPLAFYRQVHAEFLLSKPSKPLRVGEYAREDALEKKDRRESELQIKVGKEWQDLDSLWRQDPATALHQAFRVYGNLTVQEFPFAETILEQIHSGEISKEAALELWETPHQPLLSNPESFRDWLESFVEGKGLHATPTEVEQGDQEKLREDLARSHGRLIGIDPALYEAAHPREAAVNPGSEQARHQALCAGVLSRINSLPSTPAKTP